MSVSRSKRGPAASPLSRPWETSPSSAKAEPAGRADLRGAEEAPDVRRVAQDAEAAPVAGGEVVQADLAVARRRGRTRPLAQATFASQALSAEALDVDVVGVRLRLAQAAAPP